MKDKLDIRQAAGHSIGGELTKFLVTTVLLLGRPGDGALLCCGKKIREELGSKIPTCDST